MPPRRRVSAPVNRVYESGPALQQARFNSPPKPKKSKRIKSYGKKTTVRVPKPKDNTLTQMGWVTDNSPPDMSESEDESKGAANPEDGDEGEEDDGGYEEAAKKRASKRRRTMGDEPVGGSAKGKGREKSTPAFHTQTISQVVRSFNSNYSAEDDEEEEPKEEVLKEEVMPHQKKKDLYDVPSSSPQVARAKQPTLRRGRSAARVKNAQTKAIVAPPEKEIVVEEELTQESLDRTMMPPPQTPRSARTMEIPSSQSPATPMTLPSAQSGRTILTERTANIPINFGVRQTPQGTVALGDNNDGPSSTRSKKPDHIPLFWNPERTQALSTREESENASMLLAKPPEMPLSWSPNPRRNPEHSPEKVPKLEIKDTFDTGTDVSQMTRIPSSPVIPRPSPAKSVRFAVPEETEQDETPASRESSVGIQSVPPSTSTRVIKTEILDSDDEGEDDEMDLGGVSNEVTRADIDTTMPEADGIREASEIAIEPREESTEDLGDLENESQLIEKDIDAEVQSAVEHVAEVNEMIQVDEHVNIDDNEVEEDNNVELPSFQNRESPDLDAESDYGEIGAETQFQVDKMTSSTHVSETPEEPHFEETGHGTYAEKTQYLETQRIATQHINSMPARTGESDVFVSMSSSELTSILDRSRNYLIRNWKLAPNVCRVWIYETQPVSAVQYVVQISDIKRPGELPEIGIGNESFNVRPVNTTYSAYEILQVYELLDPKPLETLIDRGWFDHPPKKWERVAPAVIDELVFNLKPPLFPSSSQSEAMQVEEEDEPVQSSQTDTQEVAGQLLSNIQQFTQPASVLPLSKVNMAEVLDEDEDETEQDMVPSSPSKLPTPRPRTLAFEERAPPPLSQATTVDLSQTQTPRHRRQRSVEIVMESPSRPTAIEILSSTPIQLPRHRTPRSATRHRTPRSSRHSERSGNQAEGEQDSLVPFSMASSQLRAMTRSQLLSESLLQDSVPGPPEWVGDSEDENDIYDDDDL